MDFILAEKYQRAKNTRFLNKMGQCYGMEMWELSSIKHYFFVNMGHIRELYVSFRPYTM